MAIAASKLGRLVFDTWSDEDALVQRLRDLGLVRPDVTDDDLKATFTHARDEHERIHPNDRECNSPEERVRVFLATFLTEKGQAWAEPLRSLRLPD